MSNASGMRRSELSLWVSTAMRRGLWRLTSYLVSSILRMKGLEREIRHPAGAVLSSCGGLEVGVDLAPME